ncbi:hypothetical protein ACFDR9_004777, partial [Janthinobacterium sp. CG_23.3]
MQKIAAPATVLALAAALALGAGAQARADGQIFLCVDADGRKELTDVNRKGQCKLLDLPGAIAPAPVSKCRHSPSDPPPAPPCPPPPNPRHN